MIKIGTINVNRSFFPGISSFTDESSNKMALLRITDVPLFHGTLWLCGTLTLVGESTKKKQKFQKLI